MGNGCIKESYDSAEFKNNNKKRGRNREDIFAAAGASSSASSAVGFSGVHEVKRADVKTRSSTSQKSNNNKATHDVHHHHHHALPHADLHRRMQAIQKKDTLFCCDGSDDGNDNSTSHPYRSPAALAATAEQCGRNVRHLLTFLSDSEQELSRSSSQDVDAYRATASTMITELMSTLQAGKSAASVSPLLPPPSRTTHNDTNLPSCDEHARLISCPETQIFAVGIVNWLQGLPTALPGTFKQVHVDCLAEDACAVLRRIKEELLGRQSYSHERQRAQLDHVVSVYFGLNVPPRTFVSELLALILWTSDALGRCCTDDANEEEDDDDDDNNNKRDDASQTANEAFYFGETLADITLTAIRSMRRDRHESQRRFVAAMMPLFGRVDTLLSRVTVSSSSTAPKGYREEEEEGELFANCMYCVAHDFSCDIQCNGPTLHSAANVMSSHVRLSNLLVAARNFQYTHHHHHHHREALVVLNSGPLLQTQDEPRLRALRVEFVLLLDDGDGREDEHIENDSDGGLTPPIALFPTFAYFRCMSQPTSLRLLARDSEEQNRYNVYVMVPMMTKAEDTGMAPAFRAACLRLGAVVSRRFLPQPALSNLHVADSAVTWRHQTVQHHSQTGQDLAAVLFNNSHRGEHIMIISPWDHGVSVARSVLHQLLVAPAAVKPPVVVVISVDALIEKAKSTPMMDIKRCATTSLLDSVLMLNLGFGVESGRRDDVEIFLREEDVVTVLLCEWTARRLCEQELLHNPKGAMFPLLTQNPLLGMTRVVVCTSSIGEGAVGVDRSQMLRVATTATSSPMVVVRVLHVQPLTARNMRGYIETNVRSCVKKMMSLSSASVSSSASSLSLDPVVIDPTARAMVVLGTIQDMCARCQIREELLLLPHVLEMVCEVENRYYYHNRRKAVNSRRARAAANGNSSSHYKKTSIVILDSSFSSQRLSSHHSRGGSRDTTTTMTSHPNEHLPNTQSRVLHEYVFTSVEASLGLSLEDVHSRNSLLYSLAFRCIATPTHTISMDEARRVVAKHHFPTIITDQTGKHHHPRRAAMLDGMLALIVPCTICQDGGRGRTFRFESENVLQFLVASAVWSSADEPGSLDNLLRCDHAFTANVRGTSAHPTGLLLSYFFEMCMTDLVRRNTLVKQRLVAAATRVQTTSAAVSNLVALIAASRAPLHGANLTNISIEDCALRGATLEGVKLTGARFVRCDLTEASFVSCVVDRVEFIDCSFGPLSSPPVRIVAAPTSMWETSRLWNVLLLHPNKSTHNNVVIITGTSDATDVCFWSCGVAGMLGNNNSSSKALTPKPQARVHLSDASRWVQDVPSETRTTYFTLLEIRGGCSVLCTAAGNDPAPHFYDTTTGTKLTALSDSVSNITTQPITCMASFERRNNNSNSDASARFCVITGHGDGTVVMWDVLLVWERDLAAPIVHQCSVAAHIPRWGQTSSSPPSEGEAESDKNKKTTTPKAVVKDDAGHRGPVLVLRVCPAPRTFSESATTDKSKTSVLIATGSSDRTARIWRYEMSEDTVDDFQFDEDAPSSSYLSVVTHQFHCYHDSAVHMLELSIDGKFMVTATTTSLVVKIWSLQKRRIAYTFDVSNHLSAALTMNTVGLCHDGRTGYVMSGEVNTVLFFDIVSGEVVTHLNAWSNSSGCRMHALAVVNDIAIGVTNNATEGPAISTWELSHVSNFTDDSCNEMFHRRPITCATMSVEGTIIVTGSSDAVVVWHAMTGRAAYTIPSPSTATVELCDVIIVPDGRHLVVASTDRTHPVRVHNITDGRLERFVPIGRCHQITRLMLTSDGHRCVFTSAEGVGVTPFFPPATDAHMILSHDNSSARVTKTAFTANGLGVVVGFDSGHVRVISIDTGDKLVAYAGHRASSAITAITTTPAGSHIISACMSCEVHIWRSDNGARTHLITQTSPAYDLALSPMGECLVTGTSPITVWELSAAPQLLETFTATHRDIVHTVRVCSYGHQLLTVSRDNVVRLQSFATPASQQQQLQQPAAHNQSCNDVVQFGGGHARFSYFAEESLFVDCRGTLGQALHSYFIHPPHEIKGTTKE
eukprot:PhM_4_TR4333/c0_g1_i1/m.20315